MREEYLHYNVDDNVHNENQLAGHDGQNIQDRQNGRVVRQQIVQQYFN